MKHPTLPVKRRSIKKGALRTLYANVMRKRHRAATSSPAMPDMDGDVPNVGVARALVVIVVIHVVAVAGIFIHSRYFDHNTETPGAAAKAALPAIDARPAPGPANLPKLEEKEPRILIGSNDTYASLASQASVNVDDLRAANGNVPLTAGNFLRLPASVVPVQPPILDEIRRVGQESHAPPVITGSMPPRDTLRESPPMVATTSGAVLVRPGITSEQTEVIASPKPRTTAAATSGSSKPAGTSAAASPASTRAASRPKEPAPASRSKTAAAATQKKPAAQKPAPAAATAKKTGSYVVKPGDTVWKIAKQNGTTPEALMKANGVRDASKLKVGASLNVPKK